MANTWKKSQENFHPTYFIDFSKSSIEALDQVLSALNSEVDQALAEKRFPSLEGAFGRLSPSSKNFQ